jgi:hypothetical protein
MRNLRFVKRLRSLEVNHPDGLSSLISHPSTLLYSLMLVNFAASFRELFAKIVKTESRNNKLA